MSVLTAVKKQAKLSSQLGDAADASAELRFISDLGRSLLFTVHPKKVASRVASALQHAMDAEVCAVVAELENIGVISCAFDRRGQLDNNYLDRSRFEKWLEVLPPQVGHGQENVDDFLLSGDGHRLEYFSPRSEEHTSELQSRLHLVCRLLLE